MPTKRLEAMMLRSGMRELRRQRDVETLKLWLRAVFVALWFAVCVAGAWMALYYAGRS